MSGVATKDELKDMADNATDPSSSEARSSEVSSLTYEEARDELAWIVSRLESGQVGLEESMTLWERGEALAAHCAGWLDAAEAKLNSSQGDTGNGAGQGAGS